MKLITVFLLLFLNHSFGQSNYAYFTKNPEIGFLSKKKYELDGNIKAVEVSIHEILHYSIDTTEHVFDDFQKLHFNKSGYLTHKYKYHKKNELFLSEYNLFENDSILLYQKTQNTYNKEGYPLHSIEKKYKYTSENKLISIYLKSSFQKEFFIKRLNSYSNNKLIKTENLNNHIITERYYYISCQGSGNHFRDYIYYFHHDKNKVIKSKVFFDNSFRKKPYQLKVLNTEYENLFIPYSEIEYQYSKDLVIHEKTKFLFYNGIKQVHLNYTENKYNSKNQVIETIHWNQKTLNRKRGRYYEYHEEDGYLNQKVIGHLNSQKNNEELLRTKSLIYNYNMDGSFKILNYSNNKLDKTKLYDVHKNLIEIKNSSNVVTHKNTYIYDKKGNWISCIKIKGDDIEKITRKIEYY